MQAASVPCCGAVLGILGLPGMLSHPDGDQHMRCGRWPSPLDRRGQMPPPSDRGGQVMSALVAPCARGFRSPTAGGCSCQHMHGGIRIGVSTCMARLLLSAQA